MKYLTHSESLALDQERDQVHTELHKMFRAILRLHMSAQLAAAIARVEYRGPQDMQCPLCSTRINIYDASKQLPQTTTESDS